MFFHSIIYINISHIHTLRKRSRTFNSLHTVILVHLHVSVDASVELSISSTCVSDEQVMSHETVMLELLRHPHERQRTASITRI